MLVAMRCSTCQAQLLPGAKTCVFCGASQPLSAAVGSQSVAFQAGWQGTWRRPRREYWRVWLGVFTGGLYGPIAGQYLFAADRWHAGFGGDNEPGAPWQNGFAIILLIVILPIYAGMVLTNTGQVLNVPAQINESVQWQWAGALIESARRGSWFSVIAASIPLLLGLYSWGLHARYAALLAALTDHDLELRRRYEAGRGWRVGAMALSTLPLCFALSVATTLKLSMWQPWVHGLAIAQLLAFFVAAWAVSWLAISPAVRFRYVLSDRMQGSQSAP